MEDFFENIGENPVGMIILVAFVIVMSVILVSVIKKAASKMNVNQANGMKIANTEIGDVDRKEEQAGYYRYQKDNQIVIKRTEQQQRIFNEYFVVKNIKTTTCDSALKKKAKMISAISTVLLSVGVVLAIIGFSAGKTALWVIGLIAVVGAIGCKIASANFMKQFNKSIKVTIAPKKLMSDVDFEKLVDKKIESMNIEQLGLEKLGLDPDQVSEIHPIILRDKVITKRSLTVQNKNDHSVHSSTQHVTYLYFTDEQLFVYKVQFDMCCNVQDEWASEFFYKDICDVSSKTSRNVLKGDGFEFEYSTVSFDIIASNSHIGFDLDGDNENIASLQAMKHKIREKKSQ